MIYRYNLQNERFNKKQPDLNCFLYNTETNQLKQKQYHEPKQ